MTRLGWIGLGAMGAPMALVAARSHDLTVFDVSPNARDTMEAAGIHVAESARDAATDVDVLAIMVATEAQVDDVLFGAGGAAAAVKKGGIVLMMATVGPDAAIRWADRLRDSERSLVDAPVSGGVARAGIGDLLIMASGSEHDLAVVGPLLETLSRSAPVVGSQPGDGQKVKLVNQLLCGIHIAAAAEALAFAESLGLDARECWEVIRGGAAASFMLDDRGARMLDGAFDTPLSAVDIFVKDLGLVQAAAKEVGAATPAAATALRLFEHASGEGLGRKDDSVLIDVIRSAESQVQCRPRPAIELSQLK
jgi:3-hydroxyisobutyrate dehydrogenase